MVAGQLPHHGVEVAGGGEGRAAAGDLELGDAGQRAQPLQPGRVAAARPRSAAAPCRAGRRSARPRSAGRRGRSRPGRRPAATSSSSCEERKTAQPRSRSSATRARNSSCISGSRPPVGSSRISSSGRWKVARIRPTFCRLPRESWPSGRSRSARKRSASSSARPMPSTPRSRAEQPHRLAPRASRGRSRSRRAGCRAGRGSRRCRGGCRARRAARCPSVGWIRSSRVRIVVVLPAPLGPRKPNTSPGSHREA